MKLRRFLDVRTPLFVFGILALMAFAFAIGLTADRIIKWYREKGRSMRNTVSR